MFLYCCPNAIVSGCDSSDGISDPSDLKLQKLRQVTLKKRSFSSTPTIGYNWAMFSTPGTYLVNMRIRFFGSCSHQEDVESFQFGISIVSAQTTNSFWIQHLPREFASQFPTPKKNQTSGVAARLLQKRRNSFSKRSRRRNKLRCPTCGEAKLVIALMAMVGGNLDGGNYERLNTRLCDVYIINDAI